MMVTPVWCGVDLHAAAIALKTNELYSLRYDDATHTVSKCEVCASLFNCGGVYAGCTITSLSAANVNQNYNLAITRAPRWRYAQS